MVLKRLMRKNSHENTNDKIQVILYTLLQRVNNIDLTGFNIHNLIPKNKDDFRSSNPNIFLYKMKLLTTTSAQIIYIYIYICTSGDFACCSRMDP